MAIESIIEIKVDTSQFDAFEQRLKDLQGYAVNLGTAGQFGTGPASAPVNAMAERLKGASQTQQMNRLAEVNRANEAMWRRANNVPSGPNGFQKAMASLGENLTKVTKVFGDLGVGVFKFTKGLANVGLGLFNFTTSVLGMAGRLTKTILGAGGLLSGFTALASFMGLLKNAQTINQRAFAASAIGVGANIPTGLQATFGRYGDVQEQMSGIAAEMANPFSPAAGVLGGMMRVPSGALQSMDPVERYRKIMDFVHQNRNNPLFQSQQYIESIGLGNILNAEQFRRARFYGEEGRADVTQIEGRYSPFYQLSRERQLEVQRFQSEREAAGLGLETTLTDIMAPVRTGLSNVFRQLFDKALGAQGQPGWLRGKLGGMAESTGRGFDKFAEALGTGNWTAFWQDFRKTAIDGWNGLLKAVKEDIIPFFKEMWKGFKEAFPEVEPALTKFQQKLDEVTMVLSKLYDVIKFGVDMFSPSTYSKENFSAYSSDVGKVFNDIWQSLKNEVEDFGYGGMFGQSGQELAQARRMAFRSSEVPSAGSAGWQSASASFAGGGGTPTIIVKTRQDPANTTGLQYAMTYGTAYGSWPSNA